MKFIDSVCHARIDRSKETWDYDHHKEESRGALENVIDAMPKSRARIIMRDQ